MINFIRAGSLTTDSWSAIGLCRLMFPSMSGSVTVHPWNRKSPLSVSRKTAGQFASLVWGSIPMKTIDMIPPFGSCVMIGVTQLMLVGELSRKQGTCANLRANLCNRSAPPICATSYMGVTAAM